MAREFAKKFYRSKEWLRVREYVLRRDKYLCKHCGNPAEEIHHIIHLQPDNINNPLIALDDKNLLALCTDCHFKEHGKDKRIKKIEVVEGYEFDDEGYMIPIKQQSPHKK